jgi:MFS transporter, Spinster family, sphingosine-1-phosphate transporter
VIQSRAAIVAILTALNLVNYLDRFLVMAVSPRIQESLKLDDEQIGWVTTAFMLGYFITSPIFGWLGDRYPRKGLIAVGVLVWSVATVLSGLAPTYATMLAARIAVGVGEASYATLSPTIIDDITTPATKNRMLAIFYVAIPVGSALGFILGGLLEHRYGWRNAFFIAGGPGVVLALITLSLREPTRTLVDAGEKGKSAYAELFRSRQYSLTVLGYVAQTFALGGFTAWAAPYLYRKLCMELHEADAAFGAITVVTGLVGTAIGGVLADRWSGEDRAQGYLAVCGWTSLAAAPLALVAFFMPSKVGFLIALGACELAVFMSVSPVNAAILHTVRPALRATAMAVSIFMIHLFGDLVSPPLIGKISKAFGDPHAFCSGAPGLRMGMFLLPFALLLAGIAWTAGARQKGEATRPDTA